MKSVDNLPASIIENQEEGVDKTAPAGSFGSAIPSLSRYWTLLISVLVVFGMVVMRSILEAGLVDDTFIFFRYAENLAAGLGPVFNPGERVEGYTSPLWLLCLSVLARLHIDLVSVAPFLSALLAAIAIVLLFYAALKWVSPLRPILAIVPVLLLVTSPVLEYWAWSGLETALFTLLFLATFMAFFRAVRGEHNLLGAGLLFTLAALVRLDILILLPVYVVSIFYFNKGPARLFLRKALSFTAPLALLLVHFLWRYSYYDSWLPNTFYAKVGVPTESLLRSGLLYTYNFVLAHAPYLVVLLLASVLVRSDRRWPDILKLATAIILVWIAYVTWIGGDHFALFRFYLPILPLIGLLVTDALNQLIIKYANFNRQRFIVGLLFAVLLIGASNYEIYRRFNGEGARTEVHLARSWSGVGVWLKQNVPSTSSLASMAMGAIPYYSGLRAFDMLGLTDAFIARHGKLYPEGAVGHQKYDSEYILEQHPNYIIFPYFTPDSYRLPSNPTAEDFSPFYAYSFHDLLRNSKTWRLYESKSVRMADGVYLNFLQLKQP